MFWISIAGKRSWALELQHCVHFQWRSNCHSPSPFSLLSLTLIQLRRTVLRPKSDFPVGTMQTPKDSSSADALSKKSRMKSAANAASIPPLESSTSAIPTRPPPLSTRLKRSGPSGLHRLRRGLQSLVENPSTPKTLILVHPLRFVKSRRLKRPWTHLKKGI